MKNTFFNLKISELNSGLSPQTLQNRYSSTSLSVSHMAFFAKFLVAFPIILLITKALSLSHNPILPKAAIFTVSKDSSTLQYVARVFMGENLDSVNLVVDLNGPFVWMGSQLKSQKPINSCSLKCSMAKKIKGCCYNSKSCILEAENLISRMSTSGDLNEDLISVEFWEGIGSASFAKSENFLFLSAPNLLLSGLASDANGMLGLGDSRISLPSQFSATFGLFERKFSVCLSAKNGAISLGGNPLESQISSSMMFTPLISKRSEFDLGYYINVGSIKISGNKLPLHQKGVLAAKISTIVPYTTMQSKIYSTFVEYYVKAMNLSLVQGVAPFEVCFSSKHSPNVPIIDLVLQSELVKWRIHARNSMVPVSDEVMCLGFLDGGLNPGDSIVVGGYQIEDHMLEFDLGNSMLRFSSLLMNEKKCSDIEANSLSREI